MAALSFSEAGSGYMATATVNSDFNIHIECSKRSLVTIDITTLEGGEYKNIYTEEKISHEEEYSSKVYPKYLRIYSSTQPIAEKSVITEAEESEDNEEA